MNKYSLSTFSAWWNENLPVPTATGMRADLWMGILIHTPAFPAASHACAKCAGQAGKQAACFSCMNLACTNGAARPGAGPTCNEVCRMALKLSGSDGNPSS